MDSHENSTFHKIVLKSDGNPLYFGKGSEALDYFSSINHAPSVATNPSDFLLDLANGISGDDVEESRVAVKEELATSYRINIAEKLKRELKGIEIQGGERVNDKKMGRWTTSWWDRFTVLMRRGVKESKHEVFCPLKFGQVIVVTLLAGLLWWQSSLDHIQDQIRLLFFILGFWGMFPVFQAIFTFPQERAMLTKEMSSGMYRLSS